jgi:ATP-binding protein involved in chromosome partitioning
MKNIANIKNVIAVASGKGGVGKSTTAVNLALALLKENKTVGILDADIYGPSIPLMLGVSERPHVTQDKKIKPLMAHGLQSMSIGYLVEGKTAMVWRGPMATGALQQLINDTLWDNLDYLVLDLPPGTGDIQLTLVQKIPITGAVIVTTPQDLALLDARRAIEMFNKVKVPVLGIVENMSQHICSQCGHAEAIFGEGGGENIAAEYHTELLAQLPLDKQIREQIDRGTPTVAIDPTSSITLAYTEVARKIIQKIDKLERTDLSKFPQILIKND